MKQSVNKYDFYRAFQDIRPDNFSAAGLDSLFEWIEQLEEDTGEEMDLDVIAICCDFSEMTLEDINQDYGREYADMDEAIESLSDETSVIPVDEDTLIIQAF